MPWVEARAKSQTSEMNVRCGRALSFDGRAAVGDDKGDDDLEIEDFRPLIFVARGHGEG